MDRKYAESILFHSVWKTWVYI